MNTDAGKDSPTKLFIVDCDHNEPNHNVIEYIVRDEEGHMWPQRIIQCRLCGRKIANA